MKPRGVPARGERAILLPVYDGLNRWQRQNLPQRDAADPPPGGVALAPCPLVVPSGSLPPAELEARIARYARRAARRLPLFGPGRASPPEPAVCCMGCGAVPPKRSYLARFGWLVRTVENGESVRVSETYCPECRP